MNKTCPKCQYEYAYQDRGKWVCSDCGYEWEEGQPAQVIAGNDDVVKDSNGIVLMTGDDVVLVKDLKLKGSTETLKRGTKVRNVRVVESDDGHNLACRVDGIGSIHLKSEFVKKN